MESLRLTTADEYVLLTDKDSLTALSPYADDSGFQVFAGPREDVLRRFVLAAEEFRVETIIRATGDNPLVDSHLISLLLESHRRINADYSGYDGPPIGSGVEILSSSALKIADGVTIDLYDREHVSPYLYRNPESFVMNRITAPVEFCLADSPVTIDTQEDYMYISRLFNDLYKGRPLSLLEIIPWLERNRQAI